MKLKSLQDLLADQLKDLYSAEGQLVKALPKMAKAATDPNLSAGFEAHLAETRRQVERLETIAKQLGVALKGKKCVAMEGLIEEGKELLAEDAEPAVCDAGLIAAAQKVEHYEIASYGSARTWAEQLGHGEVARLLQETLDEEKATDEKLTQLAVGMINEEAEAAEAASTRSNGSRGGRKVGSRR
jgi:ferritin-like metal-binding protein YciE